MKLAIVDLDGTLLDSSLRHEKLLCDLLQREGISADLSDYMEYKANGSSTKRYLMSNVGLEPDLADTLAFSWTKEIETEEYLKLDVWYDDAKEFLEQLKKQKFRVILLTARQNGDAVNALIEESNMGKLFHEVLIASPGAAINSKTNLLKNLLKKYKNKVDRILFIGDTEVDYETGIALDCETYVLNRGFRSKEYWEKKNVESYDDLPAILTKIDEVTEQLEFEQQMLLELDEHPYEDSEDE